VMKMKAAQISKAKGDWELVERDIPEPGAGQVRVKVDACGICHSDALVKEGQWPGLQYPRVPGHEVAGRIDALGENVTAWKAGQRVGVGWHGGHCFVCEPCRRGDFAMCINRKVTGIDFDGGYAEYMIAPAPALAAIPDELPAEEAGPFMCAGVTVYNALRNSGARPGQLVAVHGVGGLGHLGVQYAHVCIELKPSAGRSISLDVAPISLRNCHKIVSRERPVNFPVSACIEFSA
jgi:D-arabinose 1-dehydrogenase-like Zn-dependent alcohol dehydrogenase